MVTIERKNDNFVFEINGWHKLWALKSELVIPIENIIDAYSNEENLNWMWALRMPGTHIPGIITAGTYIQKDGTIFCDVVHRENSIVVELHDEFYKKLIIEVENPQSAIELLKTK